MLRVIWSVKMGGFLHAREAHQIGAESEAGALAGRNTNTRAHRIKDGKHNRGEHGEGGHLIEGERLLGDEDRGGGDN